MDRLTLLFGMRNTPGYSSENRYCRFVAKPGETWKLSVRLGKGWTKEDTPMKLQPLSRQHTRLAGRGKGGDGAIRESRFKVTYQQNGASAACGLRASVIQKTIFQPESGST